MKLKQSSSLLLFTLMFFLLSNLNIKRSQVHSNLFNQIILSEPANAFGFDDAVSWASNNWGSIVQNTWSPWNRQVYMTELSANEIQSIRYQYRNRADGVMFDRALERVISTYRLSGWSANNERWAMRVAYSGRVENGKYNMYRRMSNNFADQFQKKRGW